MVVVATAFVIVWVQVARHCCRGSAGAGGVIDGVVAIVVQPCRCRCRQRWAVVAIVVQVEVGSSMVPLS